MCLTCRLEVDDARRGRTHGGRCGIGADLGGVSAGFVAQVQVVDAAVVEDVEVLANNGCPRLHVIAALVIG